MKLVHVPMIDEERIAAYIDGTLSPEEMSAFNNDMAHDDALAAFVSDFKTDLDIVDNGITLEQHEPNFDPIGAVDSLFAESNNLPVIGMDLNSNTFDQADPLQSFLVFSADDHSDMPEGEINIDDTKFEDEHNDVFHTIDNLSIPSINDNDGVEDGI